MKRYSLFVIFCSFLLVFSCKKPDVVGLEVLPSFDLLNTPFCDTATIQTITAREDSLRADELSKALIGSNVDPDFGLSEASLYAQIMLGNTPTLLSDNSHQFQVDSLILSLAYAGSYGDSNTAQTLHVYPLSQDIYYDSTYYTSSSPNFDNTKDWANSFVFTPHPSESVSVGGTTQPAQLRIPLDKALGDTLFSHTKLYQTNDAWVTHFKGVYIKTDPVVSGGSILYFDPLSIYSQVTLYYKEISTDTTSKSYSFLLNGARINHQQHTYSSGTTAAGLLANPSFVNNDTVACLQSMAGLKVKVRFPYLKHFIDSGNILINKAELVLTISSNSATDKYPPPSNILFTTFDSAGVIKFTPDYYENNFGGVIINNNTYKFNITRQLQQVLNGKITDYDYSLNVLSAGIQANRVIIGNGNSLGSKMKLRLFYTKLK